MPEGFKQDTSQRRKLSASFFYLAVMTVHLVVSNYRLGSEIVESKAVHGCGERTRLQIVGEGERVGMTRHARSTTAACSRAVRA